MVALFGGVILLGGLLLLAYVFVHADPRELARGLEWGAFAAGTALLVAILLLERFNLLWLPLPLILYPGWRRLRAKQHARQNIEAATPLLRVTRDARSDAPTGTVLRGTFAGSRLDELAPDELFMLLREARLDDPEGGALIENYLDHAYPKWREDLARAEADDPDMTIQEARSILGVEPGADEIAIAEAHRRLIRRLHSDHVGSDYFARKINRARDVLLRH
jgi:hypothetical protein